MRWLWKHRYSLLAICFAISRMLFFFGAYRQWFWDAEIVRPSQLETCVLNVILSLSLVSVAFGGLAMKMEEQPLAAIAFATSATCFWLGPWV